MRNQRKDYLLTGKKLFLSVTFIVLCMVLLPVQTVHAKWVKTSNGKYRYTTNASGTKYYKKTWAKIKGKYYYFDKKGYRKTGWLTYKGNRYYLNKKGVRVTGFKTIKGKKYFFSKKGIMIKGFVKSKGNYYYADDKGVIQKGLKQINQYIYYFDNSGKRVSGANIVLGNMTYYFANNGTLQYTGTQQEQAVKVINVKRMLNGFEPLFYQADNNLSKASMVRAKELSTLASHTRPDGSHYSSVLKVDYPVVTYWSGECVSWGKVKSGIEVANNWLSDKNYNVLMQEKANAIGIGSFVDENGKEYWVTLVVQTP